MKDRQVKLLVDTDEKFDVIVPDNHNDKMNLLYDLILMVYADDVVDNHEVEFCEAGCKTVWNEKTTRVMAVGRI